ncbi:MAG: PAC2 family protein [Actinobacteria bacterium]|nr:MAG: PAC2 family protein [Actinomycetota bacterium]
MATLYRRVLPAQPDRPVLIVAMEGWIDAGAGAATALAHLLAALPTEVLATFDGDELVDYRSRRPVLRISDGVDVGLTWREPEMRVGHDEAGNDVLLLVGPEPDTRWHAFTAAVVELARELGVRMVVGLGAFPAPVPHTRPVKLAATATDSALAAQVGFVGGTIDVPAGVQAALELAFGEAGIPAVGLWARVPHYVSAMAYPPAAAALVEGLASVAQLSLDAAPLHATADATRQQVDELIAKSAEHLAMVRQLEATLDQAEGNPLDVGQMPSGDEIAAELERFLRGEG